MDKLNKIIESYSPELKLLLVCCGSERWNASDLLPYVNWEVFLQWVKRHRVTPAVYRYNKENTSVIPEEIKKKIEENQNRISRRALLLTSELIKTGKLLDENNIPWFTMKGPVLAMQLYGDVAQRDYRDLDIFIEEENLEKAYQLFKSSGYKYESKYTIIQVKKVNHHIEFLNPEKKINIELHYRLYFNQKYSDLKFQKFFTDIDIVQISNHIIKQPKNQLNFSFVIEHSMNHGFSDLQWLLDSKTILQNNPAFHGYSISNLCNDLNEFLFKNSSGKLYDKRLKFPLLLINHQDVNLKKKLKVIFFRWHINKKPAFKYKMFSQPILRRYFWLKNRLFK